MAAGFRSQTEITNRARIVFPLEQRQPPAFRCGNLRLTMFTRILRILRPSHQHTAFSATVLLMITVMLSRVIGYVR